ncbi:hypothetical protein TNCV_4954971 [Trichonephila clavipes]|nr:hypothetical protein TNCV_4954971 [Trichonephila clavipes]
MGWRLASRANGAPKAPKIHKREDYPPIVGRSETCQVNVLEDISHKIVGSSGHEKVPKRKPGLERPGRPRGERIEGSCGKHLLTPSDSFNDTSRRRRSNCSTNNFQTPCRSKS